jgi:sensor domain CHASE-containing protein
MVGLKAFMAVTAVAVANLLDSEDLEKLEQLIAKLKKIESQLDANRIELARIETDIAFWQTINKEFDPDEETYE